MTDMNDPSTKSLIGRRRAAICSSVAGGLKRGAMAVGVRKWCKEGESSEGRRLEVVRSCSLLSGSEWATRRGG